MISLSKHSLLCRGYCDHKVRLSVSGLLLGIPKGRGKENNLCRIICRCCCCCSLNIAITPYQITCGDNPVNLLTFSGLVYFFYNRIHFCLRRKAWRMLKIYGRTKSCPICALKGRFMHVIRQRSLPFLSRTFPRVLKVMPQPTRNNHMTSAEESNKYIF